MENRVTKPINNRKVTKASNLKIGQLVFVKDHCKGPLTLHMLLITGFQ